MLAVTLAAKFLK